MSETHARRVYGTDDDGPCEPVPGHEYVDLVGGPLGGELLDVTGWSVHERTEGVLLVTDRGLFGPGGRALYSPSEADPAGPLLWDADTP
ncbi:hypothetical protein [Streptomyces sp. NPDC058622]|uniref:hypothetical protein n=1 Tax=Streptomyces sp. NPDC058622 TaxID=3346562 RepID=UPI003667F16A